MHATRVASIFALVFDDPQPLDQILRDDNLQLGQRLGERLLQRHRRRIAFDAQPLDLRIDRSLSSTPVSILTPGSRISSAQTGALFLELRRIARIGNQRFAVERHEQIAVVAREAGQVRDIREIRDQQRVGLGLFDERAKLLTASNE